MKHLPRVLGLVALLVPLLPIRGSEPGGDFRSLLLSLESYSVSKDDARMVLENKLSGSDRYAEVLRLEQSGKAHLEILNALRAPTGGRAVLESFDQIRYTSELAPGSRRGAYADPTAFENRDVGDSFEWEPTIAPDGENCDTNMILKRTALAGFHDIAGMENDPSVSQPDFVSQKITTGTSILLN